MGGGWCQATQATLGGQTGGGGRRGTRPGGGGSKPTAGSVGWPQSPDLQASVRSVAPSQAFNMVFEKAIQKTAPAEEVKQRVINLTDEITYSIYMYTARGLFERDKLIFLAQVTFQVGPGLTAQRGSVRQQHQGPLGAWQDGSGC